MTAIYLAVGSFGLGAGISAGAYIAETIQARNKSKTTARHAWFDRQLAAWAEPQTEGHQ